ncbi:MAG: TonB-dependent receptor [Acidobacteria bacterium]|nr:TonB-dependent receptor [Acidobacteriota bacterium]
MSGDSASLSRSVWLAAVALLLVGFAQPRSLWTQQVEDHAASHADEREAAAEGGDDEHDGYDEAGSDDPAAHVHEEIVVTGSRARERSVTKSMVPIDVISAEHVAHQGETNLDNLLRTVVPSLNISSISGDAATIVRPTNLRGLAPDHTLVLVNGKRRHRGAVILWSRIGVSHGAQGPDLSAIPAIALRQVEVLRDGASAQYGSDAIAGIMNFLLKDARSGGSLEVLTGLYDAGDGESVTVAGNVGLPWGETGFANLSVEVGGANPTNRAIQRADAAALVAAGNTHVADPAQRWGKAEVDDDVKFWINFGRPLGSSGTVRFYGWANHADRHVTARNFFFRNPNTRDAVYSGDGGASLLIGDVLDAADGTPNGSAGCPVVRVTDALPEQNALARVFNDPNCFSFQELYPGGFQPVFGGDRVDSSLVLGVRGFTASGTIWDVSVSGGRNEIDFLLFDSVNASLGPLSPTSFEPGLYGQSDVSANLDLLRQFGERLHLAGGLEWREERFEIGLGDPASWQIGPYAQQGFSSGSNGFPGFSPVAAGDWTRANAAVFGDLEYGPPDESWNLGLAVRLEDYEDFGSTLNGKIAGRRQVSGALALRASASTGFRAPTPGQQNAFNVSTQWDAERFELVNNGTIPPASRVAELRGGKALDAEKSVNLAAGAIFERGPLTFTADVFRVEVSDRLGVTGLFELQPFEVEQLLAEGITSAGNITNFRFFANDFETRTEGVDLVVTWRPPQAGGHTTLDLALNVTSTEVVDFNPLTLDQQRIRELEEALPGVRWNATLHHELGRHTSTRRPVELLARLGYYDSWYDPFIPVDFGGVYLLDVEVGIPLPAGARLAIGARNALGETGDGNPTPMRLGNLYSTRSPFDVSGAYYYSRLQYRWGSAK